MKIALSTSVIQGGRSGVARYVFEVLEALLRQPGNHQFLLLVLEEDLPLFEKFKGKVQFTVVDERWRSPINNIFWHQFLLPGILRKEKVNVLHIPSYRRMIGTSPCPTVSTIHDLAPFRLAEKYDLARMLYGRHVARFLAHRQDGILTVSHHTSEDISRFFGISSDRIQVGWNGLDHEKFHPGDDSTPSHGETPFFLYVSRLEHPAKNHVRLIEAFDRFKGETGSNWRLVLGGSDWHGAEIIREAAAKAKYADDIEFPGFIPDEALPELYRSAGAMVFPSLFEGFGMPPIEAMACGCPVICSDRGSLPEVVGDAALLVDPTSIGELAVALTRISTDSALRGDLTNRGLTQSAYFDWNETARITMKAYQKVCRQPPFGGIEATPCFKDGSGNQNRTHAFSNRSDQSSLSHARRRIESGTS